MHNFFVCVLGILKYFLSYISIIDDMTLALLQKGVFIDRLNNLFTPTVHFIFQLTVVSQFSTTIYYSSNSHIQ